MARAGRAAGPRTEAQSHIQRSPLASGSRSYPTEPRGMAAAIASKAAAVMVMRIMLGQYIGVFRLIAARASRALLGSQIRPIPSVRRM